LRAHFARHCIVRPQRAQLFEGRSAIARKRKSVNRPRITLIVW
jgi:hypothetical protein